MLLASKSLNALLTKMGCRPPATAGTGVFRKRSARPHSSNDCRSCFARPRLERSDRKRRRKIALAAQSGFAKRVCASLSQVTAPITAKTFQNP
jgi:hypothetical protein